MPSSRMTPDGGIFISRGAPVRPDVDLPAPAPDGEMYLTTKQAAAAMRVAPCTITWWRSRGYLTPLDGSPPRKPLYAWPDVVAAERTAWQSAINASGTDVQIKRRHAA